MKKNILYLFAILSTALVSLSLMSTSCNDETVNPITPVDPNIAIKDTLIVNEFFNTGSFSGINFYDLKLDSNSSTNKDAQFYDSLGERTNFQIRTGDLVDDKRFAGLQTKFDFLYHDMTRKQFDTLSKMYYDHTVNPLTDFPYSNTDYYILPLTTKPVWSFYLKGRYDYGFNQSKRIYGLFLIDSLYSLNDTFHMRLKIKINKNETDQFNPNHN